MTVWGDTPGTDRGQDILISGSDLTAASTYQSVGIAVDLNGNTISFCVGNSNTFSATYGISSVTGAKFPAASMFNGDIIELVMDSARFERPMPAGYSVWDSGCVWNSADKHSSITLSESDTVATGTASSTWRSVRGTVSKSSGKWYFEIKTRLNGSNTAIVGIANATAALTTYIYNTADGVGLLSNGTVGLNNGTLAVIGAYDEYVNAWRTVRSTTGRSGGRWYVEVLCNAVGASNQGIVIGVTNANGPLRNYLGSDTAGNSAGFQSNRSFLRAAGATTNVVSANLTATHIYALDINLNVNPPTIACRLDNGTWSAAQSIASVYTIPTATGEAPDIYIAVSLLGQASTNDSVTVNFGGSAFTYTAPAGADAWDASFGSTNLVAGGQFVEVMYANPATLEVGAVTAQALVLHQTNSDLMTGGVSVNVLRSATLNPAQTGQLNVQVLNEPPVSGQLAMMLAQVLSEMDPDLEIAAVSVQVMRAAPAVGGSGKFNRAVTMFT